MFNTAEDTASFVVLFSLAKLVYRLLDMVGTQIPKHQFRIPIVFESIFESTLDAEPNSGPTETAFRLSAFNWCVQKMRSQ